MNFLSNLRKIKKAQFSLPVQRFKTTHRVFMSISCIMALARKYKNVLLVLILFSGITFLYHSVLVDIMHHEKDSQILPVDREFKLDFFHAEAFEFAEIARDHNVKIYVIEPCVLWQLLKRAKCRHSKIGTPCQNAPTNVN